VPEPMQTSKISSGTYRRRMWFCRVQTPRRSGNVPSILSWSYKVGDVERETLLPARTPEIFFCHGNGVMGMRRHEDFRTHPLVSCITTHVHQAFPVPCAAHTWCARERQVVVRAPDTVWADHQPLQATLLLRIRIADIRVLMDGKPSRFGTRPHHVTVGLAFRSGN